MKLFTAILAFLILAYSDPASAQGRVSVASKGDDATVWATGWGGGGSGNLVVVWSPASLNDGRVGICGVYALTNATLRQGANQVLGRAVVRVDGQVVHRNLRRLAKASSVGSLGSTTPACIPTNAQGKWDSVEITFGNGSFRN
ncbi:hypothetical protein JANAI62_29780 [Jannaschia pagri]|uniref:Uncharacterized protein n=1 Tax=Jannaschia pagri TaxID=2829797 RepID=A0ABQ4NPP2_9RHOB|nr:MULTISPECIES: hypothetical protein [unclassified Jannaschia]GIT92520.1 hypothetical protein JANAI61_29780 [Jannaschia sp. AI_61]GIT96355.1 hypothetical protein JANAI62_29780 [Jannaschia sp. AI_62]